MVFYRVGIDYVCDDGAEQSLAAAGGGTSADRTVSGHQYRGGGRNFHGHLLPYFQDCVPRRRSKERKIRSEGFRKIKNERLKLKRFEIKSPSTVIVTVEGDLIVFVYIDGVYACCFLL